jgi:hypothetical protein
MNEGPKEAESPLKSRRWLVIVILLTCIFWIKVWQDLAFGYVRQEGYLTTGFVILPVYLWVGTAGSYNKIDRRVANLITTVLGVILVILLEFQILSLFF